MKKIDADKLIMELEKSNYSRIHPLHVIEIKEIIDSMPDLSKPQKRITVREVEFWFEKRQIAFEDVILLVSRVDENTPQEYRLGANVIEALAEIMGLELPE